MKILSVGEAITDIIIQVPSNILCPTGKPVCDRPLLCFNYGQKIEIEKTIMEIGGSAVNAAVAFAKLGDKSFYAGVTGCDYYGEDILKKLKKEKVKCDYMILDKSGKSGFAIIINGPSGDRTIFIDRGKRDYNKLNLKKINTFENIFLWPLPKKAESFFIRFCKSLPANINLFINPSIHQVSNRKKFIPILKKTKIIILNKEEAEKLVGIISEDVRKLTKIISSYGPKIVVITNGPNGAFAFDGKDYYSVSAFPTKRVDSTGAGDAFAVTFVQVYEESKNIIKALNWASVNSASVVATIGAQPGLLTKTEIAKRLKAKPRFSAKKI